ncbi:CRAL/TRIO domain-containing protein [Beauveria bassiana ARSEF 2860]|uniref:CRAL/TRIO domain-containing protein n=1 Tax=Beauveria bassiana (strain ARSEF 2860) TaxID=655819 RepID=J4UIP2_BEAB2|nr:CRAL/TRIO domain-containing protein [Beauveria bassiana ARSEF 2860]EJP63487.1 CRAL/TRIO domain-containing protein [Beauveria bassiana ARSEF 2860]
MATNNRQSLDATPVSRTRSSASVASAFNYPHGHLNSLSDQQEDALQKFKDLVEKRRVWKRGPPPSHNDQTLLRFLRARRWIVEDAYTQFKETEDWRAANELNILYETIDLDAYEESRRLYPQWTGRRDRRGIPLYVYEIRTLDNKTVANYEKNGAKSNFSKAKSDGKTSPGLMRLFALYENLTRFSQPFATQLTDRENPDIPITLSTNIVDVSGVGLKQFWNLKAHMQAASQLATAHYPETLDRIFIIGAPFFFSTVWGWIKRWFDPITVSKIFILAPNEVLPTLESFIEKRNIPKKYGGDLDYSFGQLSIPDPAWDGVVAWDNGYSSFPTGPMIWEDVEGQPERLQCVAVGYQNGKPRRERVCTIPRTWTPPENEIQPTTNGEATAAAPTETEAAPGPVEQGAEHKSLESFHTTDSQVDTQIGTQIDNNVDALEKLGIDEKKPAAEPTPAVAQTAV